ncbi:MAG: zinc ABC transporter ATP-binding protein ZnuC [Desulfuromonas sp.]|nr:MAG: zinc ABC transporter ATP-binding protein ZnuC [Desulfuromonas sp.]
MPADDLLIALDNVSVDLRGRSVLSQVDLDVRRGEILTLIGPNGAGKTTLLRVALGLLTPSRGEVRPRAGLRVGYVPQRLHPDQSFPMSVQRLMKLTAQTNRDSIEAILDEVGAGSLLKAPLASLSGGELQRVLLARALLRDPELLVLDEPVQGVDVHGQVELYQLITALRHTRGCSVLMVSHDLHLVMASTDRVVCLNRHICCTGTPEAVSRDDRFLQLFGPAVLPHLALYSHDPDHRHNRCNGQSCCCSDANCKGGE